MSPACSAISASALPLKRHVRELDAGGALQHLDGEMARRPVARRAVVEIGAGLRLGDQIRHRRDAALEARHQHLRGEADVGDRREILLRVVGQLGIDRGCDAVRRDRHHQERVAIRRRLGDDVGADAAARAWPVLDHHLLAQRLGELVGHHARQDVGRLAGREGHDDLDRLGGPGLGEGSATTVPQRRKRASSRRRRSSITCHPGAKRAGPFLLPRASPRCARDDVRSTRPCQLDAAFLFCWPGCSPAILRKFSRILWPCSRRCSRDGTARRGWAATCGAGP